jgi:hypothetical protein
MAILTGMLAGTGESFRVHVFLQDSFASAMVDMANGSCRHARQSEANLMPYLSGIILVLANTSLRADDSQAVDHLSLDVSQTYESCRISFPLFREL